MLKTKSALTLFLIKIYVKPTLPMLSNISFKATACIQISMHENLQKLAKKHTYIAVPVTAFVCIADVSLETIKYPIATIENVAFFAINLLGALFHKNCSSLDAYESLIRSGIMRLATPIMLVLSPSILFGNLFLNLPNPKEASSFNDRAAADVNSPFIAYDSKECRALQKAIRTDDLAAIKFLLTNDTLTNQSLAVALEKAAETGKLNAVELLLTDSRLTKQSIGRELETAAKKNHSKLIKPLIERLIQLNLNKTHSTIKKWQTEDATFRKYLYQAKEIAKNNGHIEAENGLNTFIRDLGLDDLDYAVI
ncbi:MAG: hypothetical protein ACRCU0_07815 [Candidatus Rhabdochlamydia sp.]